MYDQEMYEGELDLAGESEFDELEGDFESEGEYDGEYDSEYDGEFDGEGAFSPAEEMELAAELLTVSGEAELEQFLGKLIKKAWSGAKKFAGSSTGKALGGLLKGAAKKALPVVGRAVGSYFGGPAGGAAGAKAASAAGRLFGLELEGLSPEDREFETARRFVRFAGTAATKAATAPRSAPPSRVASAALKSAARTHAPGLLRAGVLRPGLAPYRSSRRTGRWIRRNGKIIVLGA